MLTTVVLTACGIGGSGPSDGFAAGDDFSYMAEVTDAEAGATRFGLISGSVGSNGGITGELRIVDVEDGLAGNETTEFTGTTNEDGTAVLEGIGPDGGDVTATLEEGKGVLVTDQEVGVGATTWNRASLPAFNNAVQDAVRG